MALPADQIKKLSAAHPKPNVTFSYGTAGFRTVADNLDSVFFRVAILAVLRSRSLNGKAIGVMVTASHNPERDNGVKLVDPRGEMLKASWETYATRLANAADQDALIAELEKLVAEEKIDLSQSAHVVYGHDTRPSCRSLVKSLEDGLSSAGADVQKTNAGLKTTPQLHYLVRCINTQGTPQSYGVPTEEGYYDKLAKAFTLLVKDVKNPPSLLTVDCANGVGAPKVRILQEKIRQTILPLRIAGDAISTPGALNSQCGADYVKTQQKAPPGLTLEPNARHCSFDGDADRIVFYYNDSNGTFRLLDGDKIAGLAAMFIGELVDQAGLDSQVGVVQTAYANGSSTAYLENVLRLPVSCVPTGVKHLHHKAEEYDIGVYFEANGHGTVLFSDSFLQEVHDKQSSTPAQSEALKRLKALADLINQTVGDALSDMLLVEVILRHRGWGPEDWDQAYVDLPNRLVKVLVKDRHAFETRDAERQLVSPNGIQEKVDGLVAKYQKGRSFVRPSGTEDCVRVYAEAASRAETDELAFKVAGLIHAEAGLGERPAEFL